jgi:hypothetical protein
MDFDMEVCLYFMKKQMKKLRVSLHGCRLGIYCLILKIKKTKTEVIPVHLFAN